MAKGPPRAGSQAGAGCLARPYILGQSDSEVPRTLGAFPVARNGSQTIRLLPVLSRSLIAATEVGVRAEPTRKLWNAFTYDYLPTLKPRTQERYRTSFRQLNAVFGSLYIDEITRGRLADYASDRMKAGTKGATVRRDLATLSCLCSCAVSWDFRHQPGEAVQQAVSPVRRRRGVRHPPGCGIHDTRSPTCADTPVQADCPPERLVLPRD